MQLPSDREFAILAQQVDDQLMELRSAPDQGPQLRSGSGGHGSELTVAPPQRAVVEQGTGVSFETFWQRYLRHARNDLCLPGGLLFEQWRKWRDLESKSAVRTSYLWLAAMGVPIGSLAPVAVAATVFLLNVVAKVGIEAVCEGCRPVEADEER